MLLERKAVLPVEITNAVKNMTNSASLKRTRAVVPRQERGGETAPRAASTVAKLFLPVFVPFAVVQHFDAKRFIIGMNINFFMPADANEKIFGKRERRAGDSFLLRPHRIPFFFVQG